MKNCFFLYAVLSLLTATDVFAENTVLQERERYVFERFGVLPASEDGKPNPGVAGVFSGTTDEYLIIAGGAQLPRQTALGRRDQNAFTMTFFMSAHKIHRIK